ncbi:MAG: GGDEF domain-containing protein [Polyangiaceae bacterium]|jgi:diguanylate cyclase (GGDEF)-like protein|nr:GGDEF domain-containing protein [Polyangiaceae bacterium]
MIRDSAPPPSDRTAEVTLLPPPTSDALRATRGVLTVLGGGEIGRVLPLTAGMVVRIGRGEDCTYRFPQASVSRVHACVVGLGDQFAFHDNGSTNGSFVNNRPVREPTLLHDGDRLQLGPDVHFLFSLVSDEQERALLLANDSARRDGLTGVYNRAYLDEQLAAELAFSARHGTPLSLLLVDVDHFKQVNDTFGHLTGDQALRQVAATLGASVRAEDLVARYGGEEFVVLTRGIEAPQAMLLADRLREAVAALPPPSPGGSGLTISIGVASLACCGAGPVTASTLIGLADLRLYAAKRGGRNRVVGP